MLVTPQIIPFSSPPSTIALKELLQQELSEYRFLYAGVSALQLSPNATERMVQGVRMSDAAMPYADYLRIEKETVR